MRSQIKTKEKGRFKKDKHPLFLNIDNRDQKLYSIVSQTNYMEDRMNQKLLNSADSIGLFCRLHLNAKIKLPIRPSEMGVLIYIHREDQPVSPLMISEFFKMAKPSVTPILNSLRKLDYIEKIPSIEDKRSYTLKITSKGRELVEDNFKEYLKSISHLEEKMGEQQFREFINLINQANEILEGSTE